MANPSRLEILTTREAPRWQGVLDTIGAYDFYHMPTYHRLAEAAGEGEALLAVYQEGEHLIAFPFLLRDIAIPEVCGPSEGWKDATSVYGYPGPVAAPDVPPGMRRGFCSSLDDWFRSHRVISAFSRLHPLLPQAPLLQDYGECVAVGATLSIDLTQPAEEQWAAYRKTYRYDINRLRRLGFTCAEAGSEQLDAFIELYHATMARVDADEYYYFNRAYFEYLLGPMRDVMHLFVCKEGEMTACGGLFSYCQGIVQYHLGGTRTDYLHASPMKAVFEAVRQWGNQLGAHSFHLGGGVGGARDSLFEFKQGFARRTHTFHIWRHAIDAEVCGALYQAMCRLAGIVPDTPFSPPYRHPALRRPVPTG